MVAPLGTIDFWFVAEDRRVHKTVHHFLLRALGGELCDDDVEVAEVAWVPLGELGRGWPTPTSGGSPAGHRAAGGQRVTPIAAVVTRPLGTGVAGSPAVPATRPLAAVLAVAFLLVSAAFLAPPAAADPAVTVPAPTASGPLTLELSGLAPRVVTADGPATITVTGTLHNTGDRLVGDLEVRLQRGEALRTDARCATPWPVTAAPTPPPPRSPRCPAPSRRAPRCPSR